MVCKATTMGYGMIESTLWVTAVGLELTLVLQRRVFGKTSLRYRRSSNQQDPKNNSPLKIIIFGGGRKKSSSNRYARQCKDMGPFGSRPFNLHEWLKSSRGYERGFFTKDETRVQSHQSKGLKARSSFEIRLNGKCIFVPQPPKVRSLQDQRRLWDNENVLLFFHFTDKYQKL